MLNLYDKTIFLKDAGFIYLGSFQSCNLNEDKLGEFNNYKVYINTKETTGGNIPHIHIFKGRKQSDVINACVKLEINEFFPHGPNPHDREYLDPDNVELFNEFFTEEIYRKAVEGWNKIPHVRLMDANFERPDYSEIYLPKGVSKRTVKEI